MRFSDLVIPGYTSLFKNSEVIFVFLNSCVYGILDKKEKEEERMFWSSVILLDILYVF